MVLCGRRRRGLPIGPGMFRAEFPGSSNRLSYRRERAAWGRLGRREWRRLFADHPIAVAVAHVRIGRVSARHRRNAVAPRLLAGDTSVAVVVP